VNLEFLEKKFNEDVFIGFLKSVFEDFELKDTRFKNEKLTDEDKHHVSEYKYVGSAELEDASDVGVLFLKATTENIENKRVGFSKVISKLAKPFLRDIVLVAIFHPDSAVWRLTFTSFDFKDGRFITNTDRKRFTYVLGENISVKTAQQQMRLLDSPSITQNTMKEIFNVEKVSKAFFSEYKVLYKNVTEHLEDSICFESKIERNTFAKKLLGRIVFLYFLQKKGWLGSTKKWGDGKKNFISDLFINRDSKVNFYNDILQPIFFDALNVDRRADDDYFKPLKCKMPFLNGGLFTRDTIDTIYKYEKYELDNELISAIIETFDRYNFTIIEGTPHESEVAIDPEMLGHVFEELLEDRKDSGAFYTPKEVVHYMCQQTIISYLSNDFKSDAIQGLVIHENIDNVYIGKQKDNIIKKLNSMKILDPAIGSGAFPMGMLHEIVNIILLLKPNTKNIAKLKREIVQNSIYGIDIEYSAVEIAKLRFWLSMVVDEETPNPLPNLYYKVMVGNSLLETINGFDPLSDDRTLFNPKKMKKIEEVQELLKEFYNVEEHDKKQKLQEKIEQKIDDILDDKLKEKLKEKDSQIKHINLFTGLSKKQAQIIEDANSTIDIIEKVKKRPTTELFFYKIYFAEVLNKGGFDVIIGNPPYVGEKGNKHIFRPLQNEFKDRYTKNSDLFYYFFMKSIDILKEDGVLAFITTNYFLTADGAIKLRTEFKNKTAVSNIINFNEMKLFKSALGQHNIITILKKTKKVIDTNIVNILKPQDKFDKNIFIESKEIEVFTMKSNTLYDGDKNYIRISKQGNSLENVFTKMTANSKNIEDICFINTGFDSSADRVTKSNLTKAYENVPHDIKLKSGIFVLTEEEYKKIKPENELVYQCYKSSDIEKYSSTSWQKLYVIWTNKDTDIDKYPNIKNHLEKYKRILEYKTIGHGETLPWYSHHRAREYDVFTNKDKIVLPYRAKSNILSYSDGEYFGSKDILYLRQKDKNFNIKYILALLNSKLYYSWLYYRGKRKGETLELYVTPIGKVPIKDISKERQKPFETLVDKIIKLKEQGKDTKELEEQINTMVYELYGLNDDEIESIEKDINKK